LKLLVALIYITIFRRVHMRYCTLCVIPFQTLSATGEVVSLTWTESVCTPFTAAICWSLQGVVRNLSRY